MKPIPMKTHEVRAILDGRKTQTRRIAKFLGNRNPNWTGYIKDGLQLYNGTNEPCLKKPLYQPGDILWVRETWADLRGMGFNVPFAYLANCLNKRGEEDADGKRFRLDYGVKWKPSIHMPREAARIFLRVTNVRVERLQEITPKDAWEEGCRIGNSFPWERHIPKLQQQCRDILFKSLWNKLNAKRGYGWDINPWVWVYEFERVSEDG